MYTYYDNAPFLAELSSGADAIDALKTKQNVLTALTVVSLICAVYFYVQLQQREAEVVGLKLRRPPNA